MSTSSSSASGVALAAPLSAAVIAAGLGSAVVVGLGGAAAGPLSAPSGAESTGVSGGVSAFARQDIPPDYLELYLRAAAAYGLDWAILAGIGRVECDHGRDPDPSCTREGSVNAAGAGGPMQFLVSTWASYGVDGDGDGRVDRWDPADAIFAAARYLRASGAPSDYHAALLAYNHAEWYVAEVERWAARYRAPAAAPASTSGATPLTGTTTPVIFLAGDRAELVPGDGHVAMVPQDVPATVQAMVIAGNELQDLPYGPDGHPDPRGAPNQDCSSSVSYVLYRAGVRPIGEIVATNPLAQDYVHWGAPGPGRWVTIYAADLPTPHTFVVIAGLRLDTSHAGTDVGPNAGQDGPRWRIFNHIPTWAQWSVRHPPGL